MGGSDLKLRTKEYALGIIRLFSELPKRTEVQILGRELFRSATSVGAQYREATWGKSNADFISKIEGSLQELEESEYWLELLAESGFYPEYRLRALKDETSELKGIFVTMSEAPKPVSLSARSFILALTCRIPGRFWSSRPY
ncbi:MAG TPA: four helix bundle protein [Candidatus Binatia bacterium]